MLIALVCLIILLIILMMFYHTDKEYFQNCIIYKFDNKINDDTYYQYGPLQLLYLYFTQDDEKDKKLIMSTYNDKAANNALTLSHSVDLNKLSRDMTNYGNKKLNLAAMNNGDSEWAKCYFTESVSHKQREDIKQSFTDDQIMGNNILFNRIDETSLCKNISNFIENDSKMLQDGKITKQDKILLKISLLPIDIGDTKPDIIQVDNIRIVKYNTKDKTLSDYDIENYFITNFFKLDVDSGLFMPTKRKVKFYKFSNIFCKDLYRIDKTYENCFSISQLGFKSIQFINDNAQYLKDDDRDLDNNLLNCNDEPAQDMDTVKTILKDRLLQNSKKSYNRCDKKIILTQAQDRKLRKHRRDMCVKKNLYGVEHCRYKSNCIYHDVYCNYEVDRKNIKRFKTLLNNSEDISDIETVDNMFIVSDDSKKVYDVCDRYITLDDTFDNKYNKIENLKTMKDNTLSNFDNNSELYVSFEMLQYVSQDNSIYIFIDNK